MCFPAVLTDLYQKPTLADFRFKSLKLWEIDNVDLTQQYNLSIFTDFRYQLIKVILLLPIFVDWLLRVMIKLILLLINKSKDV